MKNIKELIELANSAKIAGEDSKEMILFKDAVSPDAIIELIGKLSSNDEKENDGLKLVAYIPKGHISRYLKGDNAGCWIYGKPTAEDNEKLFIKI